MKNIEPHPVIAFVLNILFLKLIFNGKNPMPVNIINIYWTESSSEPMKNSLFIGYIITFIIPSPLVFRKYVELPYFGHSLDSIAKVECTILL